MIEKEEERKKLQTKYIRQQLLDQINLKNNMRLRDFHDERFGELTNLKTAQNIYVTEEMAKADKMRHEK